MPINLSVDKLYFNPTLKLISFVSDKVLLIGMELNTNSQTNKLYFRYINQRGIELQEYSL